MANKSAYIGIDPGQTTGMAVWLLKDQKFHSLFSGSIWDVFDKIKLVSQHVDIKRVVIENPNLNKPVFMHKHLKEQFNLGFEQYAEGKEIGKEKAEAAMKILSKKAQNVEMNKQIAKFLIEWCNRNHFSVVQIRPFNPKINGEDFKARTAWPNRTNEHQRDAAMLVYRLNVLR